jgi:hypothetical protein
MTPMTLRPQAKKCYMTKYVVYVSVLFVNIDNDNLIILLERYDV